MLDHDDRCQLLYNAVRQLEPYASSKPIQEYVARRHELTLPLLRIYVDLERLVGAGHLMRRINPSPLGEGTIFFWETFGFVLVEPFRHPLRELAAESPLVYSGSHFLDAEKFERPPVASKAPGSHAM